MTILCLLAAPLAHAQVATVATEPATLAAKADDANTKKGFDFAGQLLVETDRNADEASAETYSGWYKLTTSVTHAKSSISLTSKLGYTREYTYERADGTNGDFDNPILILAKTFLDKEDYSFAGLDSISISLVNSIGASRESARRSFLWSNGLLLTGAKAVGRFKLEQSLGYSRGFYEYDIRNDGTVNSPTSLKSMTTVYYGITDRLQVGGTLIYNYAISFQDVGRGSQLGFATIDYTFNERIAASLGMSTERDTIEPDGQSDRIRVFAPEAAKYFVDVVLTI